MDFVVPQMGFEEESWGGFIPSISLHSDFKDCSMDGHPQDSWIHRFSCQPLEGVVITDEVIADALMSEDEDLGIYLNEGSSSPDQSLIADAFAAASREDEDLGIHLDEDISISLSQMSPSTVSSATSGFLSSSDYDPLSPWSIGSPASPQVFQPVQHHLPMQQSPIEHTSATMVSTPLDGNLAKWLTTQMESSKEKSKSSSRGSTKPPESYLALIAKAILSMPSKRALLADIYKFSTDNYEYYRTAPKTWQNAIRHNLSVNDCFIKNGRAPHGRGYYWSIHPACLPSFLKGDFRRREAQQLATESDRSQYGVTNYYPVYMYQ